MSTDTTEYTIDFEHGEVIEAFNQATTGKKVNWVCPAPIHPRTTAALAPDRSVCDVITDMATRCEEWPETETTLYWDIHLPSVDTLVDPLTSESFRRPEVSNLQSPPSVIEDACQRWYEFENDEIERTGSGSTEKVLRGFFIKTTLQQDARISDVELVARYTTPARSEPKQDETKFRR